MTVPVILSYFPAFLSCMLDVILGPRFIPDWLCSAILLAVVVNGALNPIVYVFGSRDHRKAFTKKFLKPEVVRIRRNNCLQTTAALKVPLQPEVNDIVLKETYV